MTFTPVTIARLIGVTLGVVFVAHFAVTPWWIIGGASLALLFLPLP